MEISIVESQTIDAEAACGVLRRSILDVCRPDYEGMDNFVDYWLANKTPDTVRSWIDSPSSYSVVARRADETVGFGMLSRDGEVLLCYVVQEALHCGIGKRLLAEMKRKARDWGVRVLRADSTVTAAAFYRHNGFRVAGAAQTIDGRVVSYPLEKDIA